MPQINSDVLESAQLLWDFHRLETPIRNSDFAIALGCHDEQVAITAADAVMSGLTSLLVCSGGHGKMTKDLWPETEAERFALIAEARGVPRDAIILEPKAMNTAQNVTYSRAALDASGVEPGTGLLVAKPYMRRRAHATAEAQWPEIVWSVTSEDSGMRGYLDRQEDPVLTIDLMVGDLQRLERYSELGFQVPHEIPAPVRQSQSQLIERGFTGALLD